MSWRRWKLGVVVSVMLSLIVAGAGVAAGMKWQGFVAVLSAALLTHLGAFLKDHPVETISFDTDHLAVGPPPAGAGRDQQQQPQEPKG